jgi:alcohol dehydrogenase class IV
MSGFFTSPRIGWGPGAIEQLSGLGARRALVVVDPAVAKAGGHRRPVEELAKSDTSVDVLDDLTEPDRIDTAVRIGRRARELSVDWLVGIGGGRVLDGVKAARLVAERPEVDLASVTPVLDVPDTPRTRLVAIPTTSGSGSDASWTADLRAEDGTPIELAHRSLVPDWSLVDAGLTGSLTPELRLDGAFETIGLAAEAYLSAWANPFSDALALEAASAVLARLPHALRWSDDPDAGAALHFAATSAGLAASNSQRGIAHALARALVGPTGLPYGRLLGITLPAVLDFDHPGARERLERFSAATAPSDDAARVTLAIRVRRLADLFRFPSSLRSAGVAPDAVTNVRSAIVERVLRSPATLANPRVPSAKDVEGLVDAVLGR